MLVPLTVVGIDKLKIKDKHESENAKHRKKKDSIIQLNACNRKK